MFHRAGAISEKACLLGPIKCRSLADGIHNMLSLLELMDWLKSLGRVDPSDNGTLSHVGIQRSKTLGPGLGPGIELDVENKLVANAAC